ncbi:hypothetical protein PHYPO_G00192440 [Pangasianodon hypophthalmus]|uniref:Zona pellucida sperm-binding protein 3 n=1 Tax=Pangasianodon hypophthalmus TaxID=310915 RepID=A0A5N5PKD0_PANHP|nr:hypothetical protein PHYPO_G00192440 [Pangasianodon hypophthalmus]
MLQSVLFISLGLLAASVPRASYESFSDFTTQKTPEILFSNQDSPKIFSGRSFSKAENVPEPNNGVRLGEDGAAGDCTPLKDFTTSTEMVISAGLQDCGSESRVSGNWLIYSNKLVFSPGTPLTWDGVLVLKHPPTVVPIECRYKRKFRVSAEPLSPTWLPMTSTIEAVGLLHFSLSVIKGDVGSLRPSTIFQQGEPLFLEAAVHGPMHRPLRIYVDHCVATVDSYPLSRPSYEFISNHGCLIDSMWPYSSSKFYSRPKQNILRFSVQALYFPQDLRKQIFISCHLRAAPDYTLPDSQNKACYFHGPSFSWHAVEGSSNVCLCCETADCKSGKVDMSGTYLEEQTRFSHLSPSSKINTSAKRNEVF